jgi:hypothetical protein
MPRECDAIPFFKIYPELLRLELDHLESEKRVFLYNRSRGGTSVVSLWRDYQQDRGYFAPIKGDLLIIQCGIVDCAPRPIPEFLRKIIARLPGRIRSPIVWFLHDHRATLLRAGFSWRYTKPEVFKLTLQRWLSAASKDFQSVYVFNIAPTTTEMDTHSPGLTNSIEQYNALIDEALQSVPANNLFLLDVNTTIKKLGIVDLISAKDGHHITLDGHALYSQIIIDKRVSLSHAGN